MTTFRPKGRAANQRACLHRDQTVVFKIHAVFVTSSATLDGLGSVILKLTHLFSPSIKQPGEFVAVELLHKFNVNSL